MDNWSKLPLKKRAELISLYVDGGVIDLPSMKQHFNSFSEGGHTPSKGIKDYIKKTEGFVDHWYKDGNGVPTIGYGFTGDYFKQKYPDGITREQADKEFDRVLDKFVGYVKQYTPNYDSLSQNQKDSLLSYMYNVGPGNYTTRSPKFQQALKDKDWNAVAENMDIGYNDKKNPGLKKRRDYERNLFLNGTSAFSSFDSTSVPESPTYWYDEYMKSIGALPVAPEVGTIAERPEEKMFNSNTPLSSFELPNPSYSSSISRRRSEEQQSVPQQSVPSNEELISALFNNLDSYYYQPQKLASAENLFLEGGDSESEESDDRYQMMWDPNGYNMLNLKKKEDTAPKEYSSINVNTSPTSARKQPVSSISTQRPEEDFSDISNFDSLNFVAASDSPRHVVVTPNYEISEVSELNLDDTVELPRIYSKNDFAAKANAAYDKASKVFNASGKSRQEIMDMQQQIADEGGYTDMLNNLSKEEIKSIQKKLVSRGLLSDEKNSDGSYKEVDGIVGNKTRNAWNRYNIDGIWGSRSNEAYGKVFKPKESRSWDADFPTEGIDGCAKWVTRKFESVVGERSQQSGVVENAWQMPMNIVNKGGEMLFNIYETGFDNIKSVADLKNRTNKALSQNSFDVRQLQPGDVVGIYYPGSNHHQEVLNEGTTYNTHVGICTGYDKDGMPIVEHNMGGSHKKNRADKIYLGKIAVVARPKFSQEVNEYPFESKPSKYSVDLSKATSNIKPEYEDKLNRFMDSMAGAADTIGSVYPNADMDNVQKIATAVLGRETNFMQNTESSRTGAAGAKVKIEKLLRKITGSSTVETKSSDLTKFKLSSLNNAERQWLGIRSAQDLESPEKAGLASMLVLAKNYDYFKRYADANPELGITEQDIIDLTALSYNQGMGRLRHVGATSFDNDTLIVNESKLEDLRERAASEERIDDFSATKPGRFAEEHPWSTPAMKAYHKAFGRKNVSYMQSARQKMKLIKEK